MTLKRPIYMDYQATTPMDPRVLEAMLPLFTRQFGNASSTEHRYGWEAEALVKEARKKIAADLGAENPREIIFTSGATESNNLALLGVARAYAKKGNHIITVQTEHKAVLDVASAWRREGGRVTLLPVDAGGLIDPNRLEASIGPDTILVSVMMANNEIGVLQPMRAIGRITRRKGVFLHTDAAQAVGKVALDVQKLNIDLLSFSGHKIYGPKGIGALYLRGRRPRIILAPLVFGGGHERGMRSGTLNVPGIVGLAKALELCLEELPTRTGRLTRLRNRLWRGLSQLGNLALNGDPKQRLASNLNVAFMGIQAQSLIKTIYGEVAVSSGSACTSASPEPSHVLLALENGVERVPCSIRFGIGRFTTREEIDRVIELVSSAVRRLRSGQFYQTAGVGQTP